MKTIARLLLFAVIALSVLIAYGALFASSPEGTAVKYFDSCDTLDLNTAMTCLDPKYEKAYSAGSSLLGGFIGFSIKDLADIFPVLKDALGYDQMFYAYDVKVLSVEISGNIINPLFEPVSDKIRGIANLTGAYARVAVDVADPGTGKRGPMYLSLKNFGREGWRIMNIEITAP